MNAHSTLGSAKDNFNGDNAALILNAQALLDLDAEGALVPHGIGGHARGIIEAFIVRMTQAQTKPFGWFHELRNNMTDEPNGVYLGCEDQRASEVCAEELRTVAFPLYAAPALVSPSDEQLNDLILGLKHHRTLASAREFFRNELTNQALAATNAKTS